MVRNLIFSRRVDYWTSTGLAAVHSFVTEGNHFDVYLMQWNSSILAVAEAELRVVILWSPGNRLEELFVHGGILCDGGGDENHAVGQAIQQTFKHPRSNVLQTSCNALTSKQFTFFLFKNVSRTREKSLLSASSVHGNWLDGWKDPCGTLRCTCALFQTYSRRECVADAKTREIQGMLSVRCSLCCLPFSLCRILYTLLHLTRHRALLLFYCSLLWRVTRCAALCSLLWDPCIASVSFAKLFGIHALRDQFLSSRNFLVMCFSCGT